MLEWLAYNTALPLTPVPLVYVAFWALGKNRRWSSIIRDGQLCFYSTTLSAVALHDIIPQQGPQPLGILITAIIFCMILATFFYGIAIISEEAEDWKLAVISIGIAFSTTVMVVLTRQTMGLL